MAVVEYAPVEVLTEREQRARALEAAALEIEVRGWCRAAFTDPDGHICMSKAVIIVSGQPSYEIWGDAQGCHPMGFNDRRCRDGAEAAFVLRWRAEEIRDGWDA